MNNLNQYLNQKFKLLQNKNIYEKLKISEASFILEKLKISSKSKINNIDYTTLDMHDVNMMIKVLKASFIGLYKQHFESRNIFKQQGLSKKVILRRNIDYDNIYNILNDYYEYNFDLNDNNVKKSLQNLIKSYLDYLDKLINFINVSISCCGEINAQSLYWIDWHNYLEKNPIKSK